MININETRVSVIVAAHNEERHIAECIDSLLGQSYPRIEIIVCDDGSKDRTADIVRRYPAVRLIAQKHDGKARAVNRAADVAAGDILMFLDGDMVFDREYVARMVAPIIAGRCIGTCHTDEYVANPTNIWASCLQAISGLPNDRRLALTAADRRNGSTVFRAIRKDAFLAVSGFSEGGYDDDHTLYPKLGIRAQFVDGAICHHYNVETVGDVFALGMWMGKTRFLKSGPRTLGRFLPVVAARHSVARALDTRSIWMGLYQMVYETGMFCGILRMTVGIDRTYGR